MKEILKKELVSRGVFSTDLPKVFEAITKGNYFNIPVRMKSLIALSEMISFTSQFRKPIKLFDGTLVPVNAISFCIAGSGGFKDSSIRAMRQIFSPSYNILEEVRNKEAIFKAIQAAINAQEDLPEEESVYKEYLNPPVPVFLKELTPQGLVQYMNDTAITKLGAGVIINSEIGDEYTTNPNFSDLIKLLSEAFDLGLVEATYTKGKEFRNEGVSGIPINALYVGSQSMLMYNEAIKNKFILSFMSKLSRRSFFCYTPEILPEKDFSHEENPTLEMFKTRNAEKEKAVKYRDELAQSFLEVTNYLLEQDFEHLTLSEEADYILEMLKRYDYEVAMTECSPDSIESFSIRNRYWKTMKLAGSLALLECSNVIDSKHIIGATNITELFNNDLAAFEKDLNKATHERFADFIKTKVEAGKAMISAHDIKKNGYLSSISNNKLKELITLCAGYDKDGVYSITPDGGSIQYEPIYKTDVIGISYKPIDCSELNAAVSIGDIQAVRKAKDKIALDTVYGFEVADTEFPKLDRLLSGDFVYSPFKFRDGKRGRDNILNGTKWVVLDVDHSPMTAEETHFLLSDINHHIGLSSDPNNEYKFRVLIELDAPVELNPIAWKHFYLAIAKDLALRVDPLPQSQIFFSYAGRTVYSNLDGEPIKTRDYIMEAIEKSSAKVEDTKKVTNTQKEALLKDIEGTFSYAANATKGSRSRSLIRVVYHAKDLGADKERIKSIISDINYDLMEFPLEADRFDNLMRQIDRMF